jgi:hypothetical protein
MFRWAYDCTGRHCSPHHVSGLASQQDRLYTVSVKSVFMYGIRRCAFIGILSSPRLGAVPCFVMSTGSLRITKCRATVCLHHTYCSVALIQSSYCAWSCALATHDCKLVTNVDLQFKPTNRHSHEQQSTTNEPSIAHQQKGGIAVRTRRSCV